MLQKKTKRRRLIEPAVVLGNDLWYGKGMLGVAENVNRYFEIKLIFFYRIEKCNQRNVTLRVASSTVSPGQSIARFQPEQLLKYSLRAGVRKVTELP